jgi:hypothetical protein
MEGCEFVLKNIVNVSAIRRGFGHARGPAVVAKALLAKLARRSGRAAPHVLILV